MSKSSWGDRDGSGFTMKQLGLQSCFTLPRAGGLSPLPRPTTHPSPTLGPVPSPLTQPDPNSVRLRPFDRWLAAAALWACGACGGGGGGDSPPDAPKGLAYPRSFELVLQGATAEGLVPTYRGGAPTTWTVTPSLPAGLSLGVDGTIAGVPSELSPIATYTVRGENPSGASETSLQLGVVAPLQSVVVANTADSTLSTYRPDPRTGLLCPTGYSVPTSGAASPRGVVAHPSGRYVYVAQRASNSISIYDVEASTGRLLERVSIPCAGLDANELVIDAAGERLYLVSQTDVHVETFTVGLDGSLASLASLTLQAGGIPIDGAWDAELAGDGRFLWLSNVTAKSIQPLTIDPVTGIPAPSGLPYVSASAPFWMQSSRDGRFLYVNCRANSRIQVFAVNPLDGALTLVEAELTASQPSRLALSPSGEFLYATIASDSTIRTYSVDANSGALTQVATTPTGQRPESLVFDAQGRYLYVATGIGDEVEIFRVDSTTGSLLREDALRTREAPFTLAVVPGSAPLRVASPFAYVATLGAQDAAVFAVDATSGALAPLSLPTPVAGSQPPSIALHPSTRWLASARTMANAVALTELSTASGLPTQTESLTAVGSEPISLAFDPAGRRLFVLHRAGGEVRSFDFDETSGSLTFSSGLHIDSGCRSIAVDPSGRFAYVANPLTNEVLTLSIDLASGALTQVGPAKPLDGAPTAILVTPNGRYLLATAASKGRIALYSIAALDGTLTLINSRLAGTHPVAITSDPIGRFVYVCSTDTNGTGDVSVFQVAPNAVLTGFMTRLGEVSAGSQPLQAAIGADGAQLYVANQGSASITRFTLDTTSGMPTAPSNTALPSAPQAITLGARLSSTQP